MMSARWREWLQEAQAREEQAQADKVRLEAEADRAQDRRDAWAERADWLRSEMLKAIEREEVDDAGDDGAR